MHAHTDPGTAPANVYADHATPGADFSSRDGSTAKPPD